MKREDFIELYETGRKHRLNYALGTSKNTPSPLAAFFTRTANHPPVIGFGLPITRRPNPLVVTVGINPSTEEFEGLPPPLPRTDDSATQWEAQTNYFVPSATNTPYEAWFALAARFLRAFSLPVQVGAGSCSPYSEGSAVHLDLSPVVTSAFTETLSAEIALAKSAGALRRAEEIEKAAVEMLSQGLREILTPALTAIQRINDISCVVVFGCGLFGGGTHVVNETLRSRLVATTRPKKIGDATVVWAKPQEIDISVLPEHLRALAMNAQQAALPPIKFGLVSQGPSYWRRTNKPLAEIDDIGRALAQTRPT